MPEINEVRTYADFLNEQLKNKKIIEINILNGRYKKHGPFALYHELKNHLPLKVLNVQTKGKFLYFTLENNYFIFSTLGLSGGWVFLNNSTHKYQHPEMLEYLQKEKMDTYLETSLKHLNVEFKTDHGSIYFYDTLSFGTLKVIKSQKELDKKLNTIGSDIMEESTTFEVFQERINKKINSIKPIGNVLMNQKIISGIGNYLRADILWLSKISPFRKVKDVTETELKSIYKNAKLLTWGSYDYKKAIKLNIIDKSSKLPSDYKRDFFVYYEDKDIYGNPVTKEELYEGKQKRFIYWVKSRQK